MKNVVKACGAALLLGLAVAPLSSCSGGGGGGGGPVSPPPAPPPSSPPPSPPPPPSGGMSSSGGTVSAAGVFAGDFRGPLATLTVTSTASVSTNVQAKTASGSANDFVVTVSPTSGQEPTITITLDGSSMNFDLNQAVRNTTTGGEYAETGVFVDTLGTDHVAAVIELYRLNPTYSQLLLLGRERTTLMTGFAVSGADVVSMPTTGSATFDTGVTGLFASRSGDGGLFVDRSNVQVNFGSRSVTGTFADVEWADESGPGVTDNSPGGNDFGLSLTAQVSGDDFSGTISTINSTTPAMSGSLRGDFYGAQNAAPTEIGGAFAMEGSSSFVVGGLQGIRQ